MFFHRVPLSYSQRLSWFQSLHSREINCFNFLTGHHIILTVVEDPLVEPEEEDASRPPFMVVDFTRCPKEAITLDTLKYQCAFELPPILPTASVIGISVRSDPAPSWAPNPDLKVPFHIARDDRLFVFTIWVAEGDGVIAILLLVPSSTFTSKLKSLSPEDDERRFDWEEWGPSGAHMRHAPHSHSTIWVCFVFGSSFIAPFRPGTPEALLPPVGPKMVQIFDFNQTAIKRLAHDGVRDESTVSHVITKPSKLTLSRIFPSPVVTSLPYRWRTKRVPHGSTHTFGSVMLSEDAIITVTSVSGAECRQSCECSRTRCLASARAGVSCLVVLT